MSREIKFRAWEIELHEWNIDYKIKLNGDVKDFDFDYDGYYEFIVPKEDYIIEQYTGLKDKNGKEIYEGDIVKARDWDGEWGKYRIKWKQSHCAFEAFKCGKYRKWNFSLTGFIDIEVIGNIHENPELLKGEKE